MTYKSVNKTWMHNRSVTVSVSMDSGRGEVYHT